MKTFIACFLLFISLSISSQLRVDSLIIVEGAAQQLSIEESFTIENISNEDVKYFWYIKLNDDLPEEWDFYYKGVVACWGPFHSSDGENIYLSCDDLPSVTVFLPAGIVYPYNLFQIYTNNQPGKVSLDFCLIEDCGDIETAITCAKVIIDAKVKTETTDLNENEKTILWPNPIDLNSELKIQADDIVAGLRFFNSSGLNVLTLLHNKGQQYDISVLTRGLYYVALTDVKGQTITTQKLLIH